MFSGDEAQIRCRLRDASTSVEVTKWHTKNNDESITTAMLESSLVTTATIAVFTFAVGTTKIAYPLLTDGRGN